ncbi:cupin domain-containing protein [uncultured Meiothermus sp.]|jgi:quercetin dioxygenase-like cupin family protein|uniref:cupin domain-containing protein n=1 Tax=uncultured Meiothermus sp. TaxID=157471 RepID=UPI002604BC2E|nr:cupin domain-containing protein [uncultured Meiothermus sp.]
MKMQQNRRTALKQLTAAGLGLVLSGKVSTALAQTSVKPAFGSRATLANSVWFNGALFSVLADKKTTGGSYALMDVRVRQGFEAPPHVHNGEDEIFFIQEGEVTFTSGSVVTEAKPGDHVFQPRGVPHSFKLKTPTARMLVTFTPGGLEEAYRRVGVPAERLDLPAPPASPPTAEQLAAVAKVFGEYGFVLLPRS